MPMPLLIQIKGMCYEDLIIPLYRCQCTGPVSKPLLCQESHPHSGPLCRLAVIRSGRFAG